MEELFGRNAFQVALEVPLEQGGGMSVVAVVLNQRQTHSLHRHLVQGLCIIAVGVQAVLEAVSELVLAPVQQLA